MGRPADSCIEDAQSILRPYLVSLGIEMFRAKAATNLKGTSKQDRDSGARGGQEEGCRKAILTVLYPPKVHLKLRGVGCTASVTIADSRLTRRGKASERS